MTGKPQPTYPGPDGRRYASRKNAAIRATATPQPAPTDTRTEWTQRARQWHGLHPTTARPCPRLIAGKRCLTTGNNPDTCLCQHPALDHPRRWTDKDGHPVLTGEPYSLDGTDLTGFITACQALDLTVTLSGRSPWNPGSTVMLLIRRR